MKRVAVTIGLLIAMITLVGCAGSSESSDQLPSPQEIPAAPVEPGGVDPPRAPSGADGTYNCADFDTHAQAQAYFDQAGDIDGLDGNGDGVACESLS